MKRLVFAIACYTFPYVFTLFCYGFPVSLSLYSFVNGVFTIGQQLVINRMKDPTPVATTAGTPPSGGKPMKNVTPSKKRKPPNSSTSTTLFTSDARISIL